MTSRAGFPSLRGSRGLLSGFVRQKSASVAVRSTSGPSKGRRYASTADTAAGSVAGAGRRSWNAVLGVTLFAAGTFGYLYITDTRAGLHQWFAVPVLRWVYPDAEDAHHAGTKTLKALYEFGLHPRERGNPDAGGDLQVEVFGHVLDNPLGTSAGIDKNAEIPSALLALGPAIVEVGGATPLPQEGNPKPRVFRLPSQNALINRYGLNSEGADSVAMRLRQRVREYAHAMGYGLDEEAEAAVLDGKAGVPPGSLSRGKLLAVQVAKNKFTPDNNIDAVKSDYTYCVSRLGKYADIIVVNVSSPNTPGLRMLQKSEPLTDILTGVVQAAKQIERKTKPAVMVKVSPDEDSEEDVSGICKAIWASGVDGIIVGNTTKKRPDALPKGYIMSAKESDLLLEQGGYSGPQMFERTLALVKRYRAILDRGPTEAPGTETSKKESGRVTTDGLAKSIETGVQRDQRRLKTVGEDNPSQSQPLIRLPERHSTTSLTSSVSNDKAPELSASSHVDQQGSGSITEIQRNPHSHAPKVIFASGGITNGKQALEIVNAGASVAMIYTALIYGGVGTVSRIKQEMRAEIGNKRETHDTSGR